MGAASIRLERVRSAAGYNAVFRVMLDGHQVAVIPPGQTRTVSTTAGHHELYIRLQRTKSSQTMELHLVDGQQARLRCGPPRSVFGSLVRLVRFRKWDQDTVIPIEITGDG